MRIRYDDNFKAKFGADSENTIRRVMAQAQNIWKWKETLTTQVIFNIESIEYKAGVWVTGGDGRYVESQRDQSKKHLSGLDRKAVVQRTQ